MLAQQCAWMLLSCGPFNVHIDLARMDAKALELAIDRMQRQPNESGVMPPPEARQLDRVLPARVRTWFASIEQWCAARGDLSTVAAGYWHALSVG